MKARFLYGVVATACGISFFVLRQARPHRDNAEIFAVHQRMGQKNPNSVGIYAAATRFPGSSCRWRCC